MNDEVIVCKCGENLLMETTVGSFGSVGWIGECKCGIRKFISLTSLDARFSSDEQKRMCINEMLQDIFNKR